MKTQFLEIPDESQAWPPWLEQQIVGLDLFELVAQLSALTEEDATGADAELTLTAACGGKLEEVLEFGLQQLTAEQLGMLMKHPHLLIELQEKVFLDGSDYWNGIALNGRHLDVIQQQRASIEAQLAGESNGEGQVRDAEVKPEISDVIQRRRSVWLWASLAISAVLLFAVGIRFWIFPASPTWGLGQAELLSSELQDAEYLEKLAEAAGGWYNKVPTDSQALQTRLAQFSDGCQALINAPHPQLSDPQDREWLVTKCRDWSKTIVDLHDDLASGARTYEDVLPEANATIDKLQNALRSRAQEIG